MRRLFTLRRGAATVPAVGALPLRVRIGAPLALAVVLLYCAACLVYNAPASPARNRLLPAATSIMEPYFWQDWQLFGPTPGTGVSLLYLQVRMRSGAGRVVQTAPLEIENAIDVSPRGFRINPTKLPGIMLALDQGAQHYAQVADSLKKLPKSKRAAAQRNLDKAYAPNFLELQRFLSAQAAALYSNSQLIAVKATFKTRPIVPFSARYESPAPPEATQPLLETSWMAYVPGVAH